MNGNYPPEINLFLKEKKLTFSTESLPGSNESKLLISDNQNQPSRPVSILKIQDCEKGFLSAESYRIFQQTGLANHNLQVPETVAFKLPSMDQTGAKNQCAIVTPFISDAKHDSFSDMTSTYDSKTNQLRKYYGKSLIKTGFPLTHFGLQLFDILIGNNDRHHQNFLISTNSPVVYLLDHDNVQYNDAFYVYSVHPTLPNVIDWDTLQIVSKWSEWKSPYEKILKARTFLLKLTLLFFIHHSYEEFKTSGVILNNLFTPRNEQYFGALYQHLSNIFQNSIDNMINSSSDIGPYIMESYKKLLEKQKQMMSLDQDLTKLSQELYQESEWENVYSTRQPNADPQKIELFIKLRNDYNLLSGIGSSESPRNSVGNYYNIHIDINTILPISKSLQEILNQVKSTSDLDVHFISMIQSLEPYKQKTTVLTRTLPTIQDNEKIYQDFIHFLNNNPQMVTYVTVSSFFIILGAIGLKKYWPRFKLQWKKIRNKSIQKQE
jgi:hypothetical protein